ncbi:MAG: hypothetical protein AB8F65_13730 [Woeseiaceae bacterium]
MDRWIAIIGLAALVWLAFSRGRGIGQSQQQLEDQLLQLCRGDRRMMDRLVALEAKRVPGRSHQQALSAAIAALKRDNR